MQLFFIPFYSLFLLGLLTAKFILTSLQYFLLLRSLLFDALFLVVFQFNFSLRGGFA